MDLDCGTWFSHYLTYTQKVVGFCGTHPNDDRSLAQIERWLKNERLPLRAFVAAISFGLFTQKATGLSVADILSLPFPENSSLSMVAHEQIVVEDIVNYYRDLIRLGEDSIAMRESGCSALLAFNAVFAGRINGVYKKKKLRALDAYTWPGVICQSYVFGEGEVDWTGADELKGKLDALIREKRDGGLNVTRIARLYDGACIYLLKPDRLRYWLRSIALRDADETLADLAQQGF
jgi:hypothetical protein